MGRAQEKKREVSESLAMMKPTSGFSSLDQRGLEQEARRRKDGQREGSAGCLALAGSVSGGRSQGDLPQCSLVLFHRVFA